MKRDLDLKVDFIINVKFVEKRDLLPQIMILV
ncbi:hypothetical protein BDFB_013107 [Asbolus verrucosus]|uniref:Uncharacterized protein n=1 Tax=Asbolus verrucosus TaxID=1661398 RepID=A0A482WCR5_ASBVE|nr:hypothetical protein BDFB_013107 [Asbolus verrucosus]